MTNTSNEQYYLVNLTEFEKTPWYKMKSDYDIAIKTRDESLKQIPSSEQSEEQIIENADIKFNQDVESIKLKHEKSYSYPRPATINGKSNYYDSEKGETFMLCIDPTPKYPELGVTNEEYGIMHPSINQLYFKFKLSNSDLITLDMSSWN
jgi:hypothetical protein